MNYATWQYCQLITYVNASLRIEASNLDNEWKQMFAITFNGIEATTLFMLFNNVICSLGKAYFASYLCVHFAIENVKLNVFHFLLRFYHWVNLYIVPILHKIMIFLCVETYFVLLSFAMAIICIPIGRRCFYGYIDITSLKSCWNVSFRKLQSAIQINVSVKMSFLSYRRQ